MRMFVVPSVERNAQGLESPKTNCGEEGGPLFSDVPRSVQVLSFVMFELIGLSRGRTTFSEIRVCTPKVKFTSTVNKS